MEENSLSASTVEPQSARVAPSADDGPAAEGAAAGLLGRSIDLLETPCLLVDLDRLETNIARWQGEVTAAGKRLRPHIKTHKVPEIARMQLDAGATGIAVAKVAEAEVFVAAGLRDVVIAFPIYGESKWRRIAELATRARLAVNVDNSEALEGLSAAATERGVSVGVQVEIDTGFRRCGIPVADEAEIERVASQAVSLPGVELEGVTTHRGYFFEGASGMTIDDAGREEGLLLVGVAERLRGAGIRVREVTAGGTITGRGVASVEGVTEVRAGTYVFNDLMQLGFGSAGSEELALSVLATVVSSHFPPNATIDAGSKTFSGDRGVVGTDLDVGGAIATGVGKDVVVERLTEEHGMVRSNDGPLHVGERLSFFPMHACASVNLADELYGIRGGLVERVWPVLARGKRT